MCLSFLRMAGDNMAESVGQIGLDLVVNENGFKKSISGIEKLAKKAGGALAAAFAVKKLVEFGKQCVELGSDLEEVQNVVDVTFPKMTSQVDTFSKNAAASFGLSETMAKKFTGTFGAMSKAFGFSEKQAYDMSTTLTGLAGDVASFYNLSQDEAYTKLKSVFTGETESLKDLGVVMTQSALDAYAMSNGFGKVTAKMSEAEKVALRFAFVQEKLSGAAGDFARTSDSWANQTRILRLQFDSLKATLGQGLINVLTPVIKVINTLVGKLMTLANAFKAFTELITGKKAGAGMSAEAAAAAAATDGLAESTEGVGAAAKKAAKEMHGLMGFDKLNVISTPKNGAASGGGGSSDFDFGSLAEGEAAISKIDGAINPVVEKLKELADQFKGGFKDGLGNDFLESLKRTKEHLNGIKTSLLDIATDSRVVDSFDGMCSKIAYAGGQIVGSFLSVGQTFAENIVGGADKYLQQNSGYIKDRIVGMFDAAGEIAALAGEFSESVAFIFEAFRGDTAKQCTADIIGIFSNSFLGIGDLTAKFAEDVVRMLIDPIVENEDKIREAIENALQHTSKVLSVLNNSVKETFDKIFEVYDAKVRPAFEEITDSLSHLLGEILDAYNTYVAPVLDSLANEFAVVWEEHIQPAINTVVEVFGKLAECINEIWQNVFAPFIEWIANTVVPVLAPAFEIFGKAVINAFGAVGDCVKGLFEILGGILDFITGVFSGDWEKCWSGIKEIVSGFLDFFGGIVDFVTGLLKGLQDSVNEIISEIVKRVLEKVENTWTDIKNGLSVAKDFVVNIFNNIKDAIKNKISDAQNAVKYGIDKIKNFFKFKWELPKLKMPHFSVEGNFSLNPLSIPKFGVNWYAKGGIIKTPTLAMMGEGNKHEAVVPLDRNLEWRDAIVGKILERLPSGQQSGGGISASEMRSIMLEAISMLASMMEQMDIRATVERRELYNAVKQENDIIKKSTGKSGI